MSSKAHFPFSSINFNLPSLYNIECTFTIKYYTNILNH